MSPSRHRAWPVVLCTMVLAVVAAVGGYAISRSAFSSTPTRAVRPGAPSALAQLQDGVSAAPTPSPTGAVPVPTRVQSALTAALRDPRLGPSVLGEVQDADSGTTLYSARASTTAAPASTSKLMVAVAALTAYRPTDRFTTKVVRGVAGQVVLVGGGDPTLTAASKASSPSLYTDPAKLSDLAAAVRKAGIRVSRITVDDSLFTGPSVSPDWAPEDVPSSYGGAITAFMADGARTTPDAENRSATPDTDAAKQFAALVGAPTATVDTGRAPSGAAVLARVQSATVAELVTDMLQESDNVIAEVLARMVAVAEHDTASFTGGAAAVAAVLARLGVTTSGMRDGSGLAPADRVSPAVLADVLALIAGDKHPALRAVVSGLPVAGWSGTLADRYLSGSGADAAAGDVRAKTGTLTGVAALAGFVHDRSGRLLLFSFIADQTPDSEAAKPALDQVATALAGCGCS